MDLSNRDYDKELQDILHVVQNHNALVAPESTLSTSVDQAALPTFFWVTASTSGSGGENANSGTDPKGNSGAHGRPLGTRSSTRKD